MNIKLKPFAALLAMAALVMTGCKDDVMGDIDNNGSEYNGKVVHITAGIALPSVGTRSATDDPDDPNYGETNSDADPDYEYGWEDENEIRTLALIYTDDDDNYITHSIVTGLTKAPVLGSRFDYALTAEVKHEDLYHAYMDDDGVLHDKVADKAGEFIDVRVYAFCNYTDFLAKECLEKAGKDTKQTWRDWIGTINEEASPAGHTPSIQNTIWSPRSFLMTNASIANVKFPGTIEEWDEYSDKSTPWALNKSGDQPDYRAGAKEEDAVPEPIHVERVAARIDFRDASEENDFKYRLTVHPNSYGDQLDDTQTDAGDMNLITLKLTRMALVNESKKFYYLRRVSNDGTMNVTDNNLKYGGVETSKNFVVDWDYDKKISHYNVDGAKDAFNFPLYGNAIDASKDLYEYNRNSWYADKIEDLIDPAKGARKDTWSGFEPTKDKNNGYYIWRYITENTIPANNEDPIAGIGGHQITVQSLGIVFKAEILAGDDVDPDINSNFDATDEATKEAIYKYISAKAIAALKNVRTAKGQSPILYSFENRLFAGPEDIILAAVNDGENSALYGAVSRVLSNWKLDNDGFTFKYNPTGTGDALDVKMANEILSKDYEPKNDDGVAYALTNDFNDANFRITCPEKENGITVYEAEDQGDGDEWGYYCYYFYWNRHNDNQKSGLMGPMEFASVRNNVYKLAVTHIAKLGHPTDPSDDPDPEHPEDPDEPPTNYMRVEVDVLPWVVRVNNITF